MLEYLIFGAVCWFITVGLTKLANSGSFLFSTKSKSGNTKFKLGYNYSPHKEKEPSEDTEDSTRNNWLTTISLCPLLILFETRG